LVDQDPDDEMAWLWLSGTVETQEDRLACLERVVQINPYNGIALRGIETLRRRAPEPVAAPAGVVQQGANRPQTVAESEPYARATPAESETGAEAELTESETEAEVEATEGETGGEAEPAGETDRIHLFLRQAVNAIKAGNRETGQTLLVDALKLDEENEVAWLWMTHCVDEIDLKRECFERVLEINPENTRAIRGLKRLDAALEQAAATAEEGTPQETGDGGERSASAQTSGWGRRITMVIGTVAAMVLVAVVLLAFVV
jgi:ferric-dicitrate binding protein FerR (iron transport regulator)